LKKQFIMLLMSVILTLSLVEIASAAKGVQIVIDGVTQKFAQPAVIQNGTALVPLRDIFERLGGSLFWDEPNQTAIVTKGSTCLFVQINNSQATVAEYDIDGDACINPQTVNLSVPAKIINGKTMVPLRFASEYLGSTVQWDQKNSAIRISTTTSAGGTAQGQAVQPVGSPTDKNGHEISIGDRVRFSFFYGQVLQIEGGRILVFWDSKDELWVQDKDVAYMSMLAGIQYKSSSWIDASDLTLQQ
jgi:hypothetical protein